MNIEVLLSTCIYINRSLHVKNYGSICYVGIGQVKNSALTKSYKNSSKITIAKEGKMFKDKTLAVLLWNKVVFLYFHSYFITVIFTGPSVLVVHFQRNF